MSLDVIKVQIGECTLYRGDNSVILPHIGKFDAVVTDPPYGINITQNPRATVGMDESDKDWDAEPMPRAMYDTLAAMSETQIFWGGNYFELPPYKAPLVWNKNNAGRTFADFELAWTNLDMPARMVTCRPINMDGGKVHPTQKPIKVMTWCVEFLPMKCHVLDCYMGSGTTAIACLATGRKFTGIERDPEYFEIACNRIREAYSKPDMFLGESSVSLKKTKTEDAGLFT